MTTTQNLHLPQWEASDRIHHDDFNDAFSKIDAAVAGGVKIATGSYTGTGQYGEQNPCHLTFPFQPKIVFITCGNYASTFHFGTLFIYGQTFSDGIGNAASTGLGSQIDLNWNGCELSWYSTKVGAAAGDSQFNLSGITYFYTVIG